MAVFHTLHPQTALPRAASQKFEGATRHSLYLVCDQVDEILHGDIALNKGDYDAEEGGEKAQNA